MKYLEDMFGLNIGELNSYLFSFTKNLAIALVIFFAGFWIAKMISRSIKKVMLRGNADPGLTSFIASLANITLKILVFITAITQVGVEMTSFVALLGAAGLAVGMAFSGTLSNLAGGIMVLVFKPFKVGDFISAQGEQGVVKEIHIFNTYLNTPDNKVIIMPNGPLANGNITNFTKADKRRVDFVFGIAYGDDLKKAKEVLAQFIQDDTRIMKDPEPFIGLGALADSSVNITVRAWTSVEDYWPVFFEMNERVYNEFGQHGLNIPFPQMDVHVHQNN
ncbi:MAG: mechanosensitive ion channel [Crocinitomicaceae bacterium]|jgi:small conductance mechanosensitive channel|nr:mechanosensitive ion channel [Crocinitomicaceae bacterium]